MTAAPRFDSNTPYAPQNCLRCDGPMAPGFGVIGGVLKWVDHIATLDLSPLVNGEVVVNSRDSLRVPHLRGWRCTRCGVIVLDYGVGVLFNTEKDKANFDSGPPPRSAPPAPPSPPPGS